jgi:hypothetical protein
VCGDVLTSLLHVSIVLPLALLSLPTGRKGAGLYEPYSHRAIEDVQKGDASEEPCRGNWANHCAGRQRRLLIRPGDTGCRGRNENRWGEGGGIEVGSWDGGSWVHHRWRGPLDRVPSGSNLPKEWRRGEEVREGEREMPDPNNYQVPRRAQRKIERERGLRRKKRKEGTKNKK